MPRTAHEVIRPSTSNDAAGLSLLFAEAFPGQSRSEEIWLWKYFAHPRGSRSYLCESDGRIVAHCGGIEVTMRDGSRAYRAMQSVDFMSSPSYAGGLGRGGVFARTVEAFFSRFCAAGQIAMVYGFPGERHRIFGERILGYHAIERVGELRLEATGRSSFRDLGPVDARVVDLVAGTIPDFGAIRDSAYLRWRYLDHPSAEYRGVTVSHGLFGRKRTAAILRESDEGIRVMELGGAIDRGGLLALTNELKRFDRGIVFWGSRGHRVGRALESIGLESRERDHCVECRYFFDRPHPHPGEMYYTMGDYDVW